MKKSILAVLLILALLLSGCGQAKNDSSAAQSGFSAPVYTGGFPSNRRASDGFDHSHFDAAVLGGVLGENSVLNSSAAEGNHLLLPANLYLSLASLSYLTEGTSRSQLLQVLGASQLTEMETNLQTLWNGQFYKTTDALCLLGNSMWISDSLSVPAARLTELSEKYYTASYVGRPGTEAFNNSYREWLSSMTGGLLEKETSQAVLDPDMALQVASTLYYQARFSEPFEAARTSSQTFHAPSGDVNVPMMHMDEAFPYHQDDLFDAAGLSLMNGATLWILLPKDNVTPAALCSSEEVITWLKSPSYEQEDLVLSVPQFDISDHVPLIDVMKGLGAGDIFDPDLADFSGLSDDISGCFVTRFEQTLRIRLSEGGIESASYTEAVIISAAAPEDAVSFTADRPFLFALRDFDGTILFAGIVNDPSR